MLVEARISPIWKKQKLFISLFFMAIGAWFFRDGMVGYPRINERWTEHDRFVKNQNLKEWPAYARSRGWVEEPPEKLYGRADIIGQYVVGWIATILGILLLVYWFTQKGRLLQADDEAVITASGTRVPFDSITSVNRQKWESKGIARVRYSLDGRKGEFIVDDYKFDTDPTRQIFEKIEERLKAKKE